MARVELPTLEQVRQLTRLMTKVIPPEFEDINGHVNIQHYLGMYDEAGWMFFQTIGIGESYFKEERKGIFDLEHHLHYVSELHVGDTVSVHGRLLARSAKRLHGVWFIVNDTREQLANTFEFVSTHSDLNLRRTAPFPDDLASSLDALIERDSSLT